MRFVCSDAAEPSLLQSCLIRVAQSQKKGESVRKLLHAPAKVELCSTLLGDNHNLLTFLGGAVKGNGVRVARHRPHSSLLPAWHPDHPFSRQTCHSLPAARLVGCAMGRGPRVKRRKPAVEEAQPLDAFEAEDQLPAEEQPKNVNKRYDVSACCTLGYRSALLIAMHTCTERHVYRGEHAFMLEEAKSESALKACAAFRGA